MEPRGYAYYEEVDVNNNAYVVLTTASGTLTFSANAADGETVVIDGKTYTWKDTLTDVDGYVLVGATIAESIRNLVAAIMLGNGRRVWYAFSTTRHETVNATEGTTTVEVLAQVPGAAGNAITTTETMGSGAWGGGTLTGGVDNDLYSGWTFHTVGLRIMNRGGADIYFSHDGVNNHGRVNAGEGFTFNDKYEHEVWFKRVAGAGANLVDVVAWG